MLSQIDALESVDYKSGLEFLQSSSSSRSLKSNLKKLKLEYDGGRIIPSKQQK